MVHPRPSLALRPRSPARAHPATHLLRARRLHPVTGSAATTSCGVSRRVSWTEGCLWGRHFPDGSAPDQDELRQNQQIMEQARNPFFPFPFPGRLKTFARDALLHV